MKVRVFDIFSDYKCDIERATERLIHIRENDAFAIAYILREIIRVASYDARNLILSTEEPLHIEQITYEDIATLSKIMNKVPVNRSYKGISKIAERIYDLEHDETVTYQSHKKGEEESHEN